MSVFRDKLFSLSCAVDGIRENIVNVRRAHNVPTYDALLSNLEDISESILSSIEDEIQLLRDREAGY